MKTAAILGLLCLGSAVAWSDMTVVQKLESSLTPEQATIMTMRIKGSKARIDFKPEPRSSLIDLKAGKISLIDHPAKQVMVMSLGQMKQTMEMAAKSMTAQAGKKTFRKTENIKTINGFKCREYIVSSTEAGESPMSCWMAEDVDAKEMDPFREFAMDITKLIGQDTIAQLKGMMIATESTLSFQGKESKSRMEVQSLSREAIADSVFDIPPGYQSMEMPALPSSMPPPSK